MANSPPTSRRAALAAAASIATGIGVALLPAPAGLTPDAWRYVALFAAVVVGLITEPIPAPAMGFAGMALAAASRLVTPDPAESLRWALSGFANATVWLVFAAFVIALGYERTGLGRRIALVLVRRLGSRTLGLGYAVALADFVLGPFTPSNTARSAGTIFPIARNIPDLFESAPGSTSRRIGGYVMWTAFAATTVTSSTFATALAPNLLAIELVSKTTGIRVTPGEWFAGVAPVGLLLILAVPLVAYVLYPPQVKRSPEAPAWAARELAAMGRVTPKEWLMAGLAVLAVTMWTLGGQVIDPAATALVIVVLMLATRLAEWQDVVTHWRAWNVMVLLATLVALSDGLVRVGFIPWFARGTAGLVGQLGPAAATAVLVAVFFLSHYMCASVTAHTAAFLPVMLAAGAAVPGVPVRTLALLLCYSLGLMGVITPYATGPAPVYFGSGFVPRLDFWRLGAAFGLLFLAALLLVGYPYLVLLGAGRPLA
jgi:L-tartrate/succinate antiporter